MERVIKVDARFRWKVLLFGVKKDCVQLAIKGIIGIAYIKNYFPTEGFIAVYSIEKSLHLRVWRFFIAVGV